MKTNIESISSVLKKVLVEVSGETVSSLRKKLLADLQSKANMPGFRNGKVPISVLEKMYSDGLNEELKNSVLSEALRHVEAEDGLKVVGLMKSDVSLENGEVVLEVEVEPEIETPDCSYLVLDDEDVVVTDEEVDNAVAFERKRCAEYKVVQAEAKSGDYVKLSYAGRCGDLQIDKLPGLPRLWGNQRATWEEAGAANVDGIPAVVKAIVGMKAGDKTSVSFTIPNDFPAVEIAGKDVVYDIEVLEVRECLLPELDEVFFKNVGVGSLDELKEVIRKRFFDKKSAEIEDMNKGKVVECLIGQLKCELPSSLLKAESEKVLQEMVNVFSAKGVSEDVMNEQKQSVINRAKEIATEKIKLDLCVNKVAQAEKVNLDGKDFEPAIMQFAMREKVDVNKLLSMIKKDNNLRREVFQRALQIKVVNMLYNRIKNKANKTA